MKKMSLFRKDGLSEDFRITLKFKSLFKLSIILLALNASIIFSQNFSFNVLADVNNYSKEKYNSGNYFKAGIIQMKEKAVGEFAIVPGDLHPPWSAFEVMKDVLGENYRIYPAIGNHELDSRELIEWMKKYLSKQSWNKGPVNSEETTYSFDYKSAHFVSLNFYYDGESDEAEPPQLNDKLLDWLEKDLSAAEKKYIFVFGHLPIVSLPDFHNSRIRHSGGNLDEKENFQRFMDILRRNKVSVYFCGHTHNFSYAQINGVWQFDVGHLRGIGDEGAKSTFFEVNVNSDKIEIEVYRLNDKIYELTNKIQIKPE